MASKRDDGGSAFPTPDCSEWDGDLRTPGMTLRDWFAGQLHEDDRLVKCIRAMDDEALEVFGSSAHLFATNPKLEREEWITETTYAPEDYASYGEEIQKVFRRLFHEARAIAVVRYMQADAMIAARSADDKQNETTNEK